jgi:hypothetical protein
MYYTVRSLLVEDDSPMTMMKMIVAFSMEIVK